MIRLLLLSCLLLAGCAAAPVPGSDSAADPTQVETRPSLTFAVEVTVNADDDKLQAARQFYAQLGIKAEVVGSRAGGSLELVLSDGHSSIRMKVEPYAVREHTPKRDRDPARPPTPPQEPRPNFLPLIHATWTVHVNTSTFDNAAALPGARRDAGAAGDTVIVVDPLGLMLRLARATP